jgi:hypothetical protein
MLEGDTLSNDLGYEDALRKAHSEGWRDPVEITNLEIKAYEAGMITEINRVLSLFKDLEVEPVMRVMDMIRRLDKVRNP